MKKLICYILQIAITFNVLSSYSFAAASTNMLHNESFNDYITNEMPLLDISGGNSSVIEYGEKEKVLKIDLTPLSIDYTIDVKATENFVFSFDLGSVDSKPLEGSVMLEDSIGRSFSVLNVNEYGEVNNHIGKKIAGYGKKLNNIAVAYDIADRSYDIYVNGKIAVSNVLVRGKYLSDLNLIKFRFKSIDDSGSVLIDNINVFHGNKPLKKYPVAEWNPEVQDIAENVEVVSSRTFLEVTYSGDVVRLPVANDNNISVVDDGDNRCLQVEMISNLGSTDIIGMGMVSTNNLVITFDINLRTELNSFYFCITDQAGALYPLGITNCVLGNGGKLKPGKWYTVTALIDFTLLTMDLYLDDKQVAKDVQLTNVSQAKSGNIGGAIKDVRLEFKPTASPSKIWFDNLRVYEGTEIKDFNVEFDASSAVTLYPSDATEAATMSAYIGGFHKKSGIMFVEKAKKNMLIKPYEKDGELMVSAADAAELFNKEYEYDDENKSVTLGGIEFKEGSSKIIVDENEVELGVACETNAGLMSIPVFKAADAFGLKYAVDDKAVNSGLVIFAENKPSLPNGDRLQTLNDFMLFERISPSYVLDLYEESPVKNAHPRLLCTQEDINNILLRSQTDSTIKEMVRYIVANADTSMKNAVAPVGYDAVAGIELQRKFRNVVVACSTAYVLTNDRKYFDRCIQEFEALNTWSDYGDGANLALGPKAVLHGLAIGYDLLYNYMTDEQKELVEKIAYEKILKKRDAYYYDINSSANKLWITNYDNFNAVNHSANGMMALALMDVYPDACSRIIANASRGLEYVVESYEPYGVYYEGPGYWDYATRYIGYFLNMSRDILGTTYGLTNSGGLEKTLEYGLFAGSDVAYFNFADAGVTPIGSAEAYLLMAKLFDRQDLAKYTTDKYPYTLGTLFGLANYDYLISGKETNVSKDYYVQGDSAVICSRETFDNKASAFFGARAGGIDNISGNTHSHMDQGTFVYDVNGIRWAHDLGNNAYVNGYWSTNRWKFLKCMPEGHNCLVINPGTTTYQYVRDANADVIRYETNEKGVISILDMSKLQSQHVKSAKRGFFFTDDRRSLVIRDEVELKAKSDDIYWIMNTGSDALVDAEISGNSVLLSQNGQQVKVEFLTNASNMEILYCDVAHLPGSEVLINEDDVSGQKRILVKLSANGKFDFTAKLTPIGFPSTPISDYNVSMDSWKLIDGEQLQRAVVDGITVDGIPVNGFTPDKEHYKVYYNAGESGNSNVTVDYDESKYNVVVNNSSSPICITVTDKKYPQMSTSYYIDYMPLPSPVEFRGTYALPVIEYSCAWESATEGVRLAFDNNLETHYAAAGYPWILMDLGSQQKIDGLFMAFYLGNERMQYFDVEVSSDGENFVPVTKFQSNGLTEDYQNFEFPSSVNARYVRVNLNQTSTGSWNSVKEIEVYNK